MPNKSVEKVAEEQLHQEEAARREQRLEELKSGEEKRRSEKKRLADLEEISSEATQEAERLAEERLQIEEALQTKLTEFSAELEKLTELDGRHARENMKLRRTQSEIEKARTGTPASVSVEELRSNKGGTVQTSLRKTVSVWITDSLPEFFDPRPVKKSPSQTTLAQRDPMTPGAQREPSRADRPVQSTMHPMSHEELRDSIEADKHRGGSA